MNSIKRTVFSSLNHTRKITTNPSQTHAYLTKGFTEASS